MLSIDKKIVKKFPPPYKWTITPYKQDNFSPETLKVLKYRKPVFVNVCKAILIGDVAVGKTTILKRFCHGNFDHNYKATIGVDFEIEYFQVLNETFNIQIWDTAGQERFQCIAEAYYRNSNIIVIVFDLTKTDSLLSAPKWLKTALNANKLIQKPLIFLVGTKSDELSETELDGIELAASEMAKKMEAEFWSVSAKTGYQIVELFQRIVALAFDDVIKYSTREETDIKNCFRLSRELNKKRTKFGFC